MRYSRWREHCIKYIILGFLNLYYMAIYVNAYNSLIDVELSGERVNAPLDRIGGKEATKEATEGTKEATEDSYYGTDWERMDKEFEKFLGEDDSGEEANLGRTKGANLDKDKDKEGEERFSDD